MTQDERNKLGQLIGAMAVYYGRSDISSPVISMFLDDLAAMELSYDEATQGYTMYRRNAKNKTFPLPAQICELINPQLNPDQHGREIAARIQGAIVKHGYSNAADAQADIGPLGWEIVRSMGGWSYICEHHGLTIDPSVFQAQVRDRARDMVQHGNALSSFNRPQLTFSEAEEDKSKQGLTSVRDILNMLPEPKGTL